MVSSGVCNSGRLAMMVDAFISLKSLVLSISLWKLLDSLPLMSSYIFDLSLALRISCLILALVVILVRRDYEWFFYLSWSADNYFLWVSISFYNFITYRIKSFFMLIFILVFILIKTSINYNMKNECFRYSWIIMIECMMTGIILKRIIDKENIYLGIYDFDELSSNYSCWLIFYFVEKSWRSFF